MNRSEREDEPAFPVNGGLHENQYNGMGLRDYFAAKALPAVMKLCRHDTLDEGESLPAHCAAAAYLIADAMLAARQP